jgi:hypothetical protein
VIEGNEVASGEALSLDEQAAASEFDQLTTQPIAQGP